MRSLSKLVFVLFVVFSTTCLVFSSPTPAESETDLLAASDAPKSEEKSTGPEYNAQFMEEVLSLINVEREKVGVGLLCLNKALTNAALLHSLDQYNNQKMSHTGSDGSNPGQRIDRQNYGSLFTWGENVAYWYQTPASVMNAWMNSAGHRANILNPDFSNIGIGFVGFYWTQVFAGPIGFTGCDMPNNKVVFGCDNLVSDKTIDACDVCGGDGSSCSGSNNYCRVKASGATVADVCSSMKWHCSYFNCDTSKYDITCSSPAKLLEDANILFDKYYQLKGVCSKKAGEITSDPIDSSYDPFNLGSEKKCRVKSGSDPAKVCSTSKWACNVIACSFTIDCSSNEALLAGANDVLNMYYQQKGACSRSVGELVDANDNSPYDPFNDGGSSPGGDQKCQVRTGVLFSKVCSVMRWTCSKIDCSNLQPYCETDPLNAVSNVGEILNAYYSQKGACSGGAGELVATPSVKGLTCTIHSSADASAICTAFKNHCNAHQTCTGVDLNTICNDESELIAQASLAFDAHWKDFAHTGVDACKNDGVTELYTV